MKICSILGLSSLTLLRFDLGKAGTWSQFHLHSCAKSCWIWLWIPSCRPLKRHSCQRWHLLLCYRVASISSSSLGSQSEAAASVIKLGVHGVILRYFPCHPSSYRQSECGETVESLTDRCHSWEQSLQLLMCSLLSWRMLLLFYFRMVSYFGPVRLLLTNSTASFDFSRWWSFSSRAWLRTFC